MKTSTKTRKNILFSKFTMSFFEKNFKKILIIIFKYITIKTIF